MKWTPQTAFEQAATHYTHLAQQPGWWEHCQKKVTELELDDSGIWIGLREEIRKRLKEAKSSRSPGRQVD